jgi:hypothetical protein
MPPRVSSIPPGVPFTAPLKRRGIGVGSLFHPTIADRNQLISALRRPSRADR